MQEIKACLHVFPSTMNTETVYGSCMPFKRKFVPCLAQLQQAAKGAMMQYMSPATSPSHHARRNSTKNHITPMHTFLHFEVMAVYINVSQQKSLAINTMIKMIREHISRLHPHSLLMCSCMCSGGWGNIICRVYTLHTILSLQGRVLMHIPGVAIERKNAFHAVEK